MATSSAEGPLAGTHLTVTTSLTCTAGLVAGCRPWKVKGQWKRTFHAGISSTGRKSYNNLYTRDTIPALGVPGTGANQLPRHTHMDTTSTHNKHEDTSSHNNGREGPMQNVLMPN